LNNVRQTLTRRTSTLVNNVGGGGGDGDGDDDGDLKNRRLSAWS